jgi:hypothetical protein
MDYAPVLAETIDTSTFENPHELDYSGVYEVEIRAYTIVAVEMIMNEIKKNEVLKDKIKYAF